MARDREQSPIDLPTEAQWEYAARSGGNNVAFATENGKYDPDRNFPSSDRIADKLAPDVGIVRMYLYPVGKYPANPPGLFDMRFDGRDWVNDWFGADYYAKSAVKNPQGPASGTMKVIRGAEGGNEESAMTMCRYCTEPAGHLIAENGGKSTPSLFITYTFRCALQSAQRR